jgi:hypothetical protein
MASRNINITVTVRDGASAKMKQVERNIKKVGDQTEKLNNNFLKFNRTLFTTTAFIGTFVAAFKGLSSAITAGADFERVEKQFENAFGTTSSMSRHIGKFTDAAVSEFESMQKALELKSLGLVSSTEEASKFLAMGAAAARRYGKDSSEGLRAVTEFLKTHDITQLQSIGILNKANKEFLAQQGIIGAMGTPINAMLRSEGALNLGLKALSVTVKDSMFGFEDLKDILEKFGSSYTVLKSRVGEFLGQVFSPMIKKFTEFSEKLADSLEKLHKVNPELLAMAKIAGFTTIAVASLVATLGTLKLISIALASTGFGLPKLISILLIGAGIFKSVTNSVDSVNERLKLFTGFARAIYQLISSFDKTTGISKLDRDLKQLLDNHGLLSLAENIARISITIKEFVKDVGSTLINWGKEAFSWINKITDAIKGFLGIKTGPWSQDFISGMDGIRGVLVKVTAGILGFKLLKGIFGSILPKIPGIGSLFGGGASRGSSPANPMYVRDASSISGALSGLGGAAGASGIFAKIFGIIKTAFMSETFKKAIIGERLFAVFARLAQVGAKTFLLFSKLSGVLVATITSIGAGLLFLTKILAVVGAAIGAVAGAAYGGFKLGSWLDEKFIKPMLWGRSENEEAPQVAHKSQTSTPYSYKDELQKVDELGSEIASIKDAEKRQNAQTMMEAFLGASSAGGQQLTDSEQALIRGIISSNETLTKIEENTRPGTKSIMGSRRGD